jgi:hypothetical protein
VIPDRPVPVALGDLIVSRDRALEVAQEILRSAAAQRAASGGTR